MKLNVGFFITNISQVAWGEEFYYTKEAPLSPTTL